MALQCSIVSILSSIWKSSFVSFLREAETSCRSCWERTRFWEIPPSSRTAFWYGWRAISLQFRRKLALRSRSFRCSNVLCWPGSDDRRSLDVTFSETDETLVSLATVVVATLRSSSSDSEASPQTTVACWLVPTFSCSTAAITSLPVGAAIAVLRWSTPPKNSVETAQYN